MQTNPITGPTSPLRALRRSRRLCTEQLTIMVPIDGYYAQQETCRALRALGHRVVEVVLGEKGDAGPTPENIRRLLTAAVNHRPDMMLSINYSGFDRAHFLTELIETMALPTAVWFVDNPIVIAMGWIPPTPTSTSFFVWDKSYVGALQAFGAQRVHHLPLGTDETIFTPGPSQPNRMQPIGFVGHSLGILEDRWKKRLTCDEQKQARAMAEKLAHDRGILHGLVTKPLFPLDRATMVLAYGSILASKRYRLELLRALPQHLLHATGDAHWVHLLPKANHHGNTDYGEELAQVFRDTVINVNATNMQMPCTVNQRVFDVPATQSFLVTDHQEEMDAYFKLGHDQEMVVYRTAEELKDVVAYYRKHPEKRRQMAARARARVLGEHTYRHRLQTLVAVMRQNHGSLPAGATLSRPD